VSLVVVSGESKREACCAPTNDALHPRFVVVRRVIPLGHHGLTAPGEPTHLPTLSRAMPLPVPYPCPCRDMP